MDIFFDVTDVLVSVAIIAQTVIQFLQYKKESSSARARKEG